jgi:hypothetical protein
MNDLEMANMPTKYKIRIHSQAFVLVRREFPKKETQRTETGMIIMTENWYDEHALGEFAVNHNGNEVKFSTLKGMLANLSASIIKSMKSKGLIRW